MASVFETNVIECLQKYTLWVYPQIITGQIICVRANPQLFASVFVGFTQRIKAHVKCNLFTGKLCQSVLSWSDLMETSCLQCIFDQLSREGQNSSQLPSVKCSTMKAYKAGNYVNLKITHRSLMWKTPKHPSSDHVLCSSCPTAHTLLVNIEAVCTEE